jgi:hypothetical protein
MKTTTMDDPVNLKLPAEWPTPRPGCAECAALDAQRSDAQSAGDFSLVSDCNVKMRRHHARRRRQQHANDQT